MEIDFKKSKLFEYYEYELICLAKNIVSAGDSVFRLAPKTDGYYEKCSSEAHLNINSLLSEAAKIKKLIDPVLSNKENKHSKKYKMKFARKHYFSELLCGLTLKEIMKPKVRNTLEHFDEYLDGVNIELMDPRNIKHDVAFSNLILSSFDHPSNKSLYPIRIYTGNDRKYHNMRWSVEIGCIYDEAKSILLHLREKNEGADLLEEVGAMGLVLRDVQT